MPPTPTTVPELLDRYDVFFLDAYGVLVHTKGALPGAAELLGALRERGKRWVVLSNDASRLPSTTAKRYRGFGLDVGEEDVITSGSLLAGWLDDEGLAGSRCIVLGTDDSVRYVEQGGGEAVGFDDARAEVVVVADDDGYPFLDGIERVVTTVCRRLDGGEPVRLVLPNPDRIYPKDERTYGLASGSVALVIESALEVRYPGRAPKFVGLGKPHRPMYEAAMRHTGADDPSRVVMLGDQLPTDIKGAQDFGIDSVLLGTGLTHSGAEFDGAVATPTWSLPDLRR